MTQRQSGFRKISNDAVLKATGKGWEAWFAILDTWGAKDKGHTATAQYLNEKHDLSPWWSQAASIRYEWERGLRK